MVRRKSRETLKTNPESNRAWPKASTVSMFRLAPLSIRLSPHGFQVSGPKAPGLVSSRPIGCIGTAATARSGACSTSLKMNEQPMQQPATSAFSTPR